MLLHKQQISMKNQQQHGTLLSQEGSHFHP